MAMTMTDLTDLLPDAIQCEEGVSDPVLQMVHSIEDIDKGKKDKYKIALKHLMDLAHQYETQMCSKVSHKTQLLHEMASKPQTTIDLGLNLDKLNMFAMYDSVIGDSELGITDKAIILGMKLVNFLAVAVVLYMFAKLILS